MANAADAANYQLLTLTKGNKEIPLEGKTTSFDYYESLLSPNITAIMTIIDTGSTVNYDSEYDKQERLGTLYNALPLTGDGSEEVRFKISNALGTLDFSQTPLYVNGAINPDQESSRESIILNLVSKSAITNQETHVKKNYSKSTNNTHSVKLIASNILKIDKLFADETSNKHPFIGNNKSPFDVICMLASKSTPENGNPGFFFYETRNGHHFKSIDNLISKGPVAEYYKKEIVRSSVNTDNNFKISLFSINKNQNLINALKSGVYSSRKIVFNPKTFKIEENPYNIETLKKSLGKSEAPTPQDQKYTRVLFGIKDVGALSPKVEESDEGDLNSYQGKVQMRYNLLFTQIVKIQVPCNPNLKAGDIIKCELETITPDEKIQGVSDPVESGNYMILDLCHHYDTKRSFTAMTLVRDTYGLHTNKS
tara:strand:- start:473 stop:1744 length:1272 start_codon:yes stop_codon:yes gene_type:complete